MARVDWITWKTEKNEIINPTKILDEITDLFSNYNVYMNSVVSENIQYEISRGALDQNSISILGESPANRKATEIMTRINIIKQLMNHFKQEVYQNAEDQKQIEKEQLIECIEAKIKEEELKKENTIALSNRLKESNSYITKQEVEDIIEITTDRINRLKERLEIARSI